MTKKCPQDGGFIGDAGCTHPNHQHSELVKKVISSSTNPSMMSEADATSALTEGFYVSDPSGKRLGFGKGLLNHIDNDPNHAPGDAKARKERLQFAVATVTHPDRKETNHRMIPGRTAYTKAFKDFGIIAITEKESDAIAKVFTYFPRRGGKKR